MKYLSLLLLIISLNSFSQTYKVPVSSGNRLYIRKGSNNVVTLPRATSTDSLYQFELKIIKKSIVVPPPPVNQAPIARAGNDIALILPANTATLDGSGSTDADGSIVSYTWTLVSGGSHLLINATSATASLVNLVAGTYTFKLTVTDDKGATGSDNINVVVMNTPPPPDTTATGYEGFGINAIGGSQSATIYHVTNLNSSGSGSLAEGLGSNRTIVFDVAGTITGRFNLTPYSYWTIDGSTAPAPGITIDGGNNGDALSMDASSCHHWILKYIRVRNAGNDGIGVNNGSNNFIIDHVSSYENRDGNIDITSGSHTGTVSYCFIGGGANDGGYSGSSLLGYSPKNISYHHNFLSPVTPGQVGERAPNISDPNKSSLPNFLMADVRNNLVWKWGRNGGTGSGYATSCAYYATANIVNNYYYSVQSPKSATNIGDGYGNGATGKCFINGNVSGNTGYDPNAISNAGEYAVPDAYKIRPQSACDAARLILKNVGLPVKTAYESTRINDVSLINCN